MHMVFSGRRGFHVHVLDFDLLDWTHYNDRKPLKSHEVARYKYTRHLKAACGGFDRHHFILRSDVTRVITLTRSLNGETGLICSYLVGRKDFEATHVSRIVWGSKALRFLYDRARVMNLRLDDVNISTDYCYSKSYISNIFPNSMRAE